MFVREQRKQERLQFELRDIDTEYNYYGLYSKTIPFNKGDILFVFSDGLTEAENNLREQYREKRLKQILKQNAKEDIKNLGNKIILHNQEYCEGVTQIDDITCCLLKLNPTIKNDEDSKNAMKKLSGK